MNRTREVLIEKGISQTELAKQLGKGFNMVNLYATSRVPCIVQDSGDIECGCANTSYTQRNKKINCYGEYESERS